MLKDKYGKHHHMKHAEAQQSLFKHCSLLDPLRNLKGIAEDVKIRGDLQSAYIEELTGTLSVTSPSAAIKKKQAQAVAAKKARRERPDQQKFWAELMEKAQAKGDHGQAELCANMIRTSVKSPAVMAELMRPPTKEDMDRYRAERAQAVSTGTATENDEGEDSRAENGVHGGIGVLNGKPVLGPPRPPGLH